MIKSTPPKAVKKYLSQIGKQGGKAAAAKGLQFTSERGRAAAMARWRGVRQERARTAGQEVLARLVREQQRASSEGQV
jgi:hypothetical protein